MTLTWHVTDMHRGLLTFSALKTALRDAVYCINRPPPWSGSSPLALVTGGHKGSHVVTCSHKSPASSSPPPSPPHPCLADIQCNFYPFSILWLLKQTLGTGDRQFNATNEIISKHFSLYKHLPLKSTAEWSICTWKWCSKEAAWAAKLL